MRTCRLIVAVAAVALATQAALAQDAPRPSWIDVTLTHYVAGHAGGLIHEAGHAGAALLTGGSVRGWNIHLFRQTVNVTADKPWKRVVISLAGPLTLRALHELPRWIHEPTDDGRYYRFAASFAFTSRLQLLMNSPVFHFWGARDVLSASRAMTRDRTSQVLIASGLTLLAIADVAQQWDELEAEYRIFTGATRFPGSPATALSAPVAIPLVTIRF